MVRYARDPSTEGFNRFNLISSYNFVEIEDSAGRYARVIKDSLKDFNEPNNDELGLERKVKSVKYSSHKSSKKK